jgi:hypothetical protein
MLYHSIDNGTASGSGGFAQRAPPYNPLSGFPKAAKAFGAPRIEGLSVLKYGSFTRRRLSEEKDECTCTADLSRQKNRSIIVMLEVKFSYGKSSSGSRNRGEYKMMNSLYACAISSTRKVQWVIIPDDE